MKLTDFGIAKAMNKREHTGVGVVKGKVAFMSPEQAMGKDIDARSDLFSLGTVLYLLVTRTRPFEGPSELETLLRVQKGDFRAAQQAAPDLPPEVAALVARAMHPDPDQRYQTADEMLADVERVLRTAFHPVGQTELKKWLAELSRRDGVPPISRSTARATAPNQNTGSSDLDEQDVVLLDTDADVVDGQEPTAGGRSTAGAAAASRRGRGHPHAGHHARSARPDDAEAMARASPEELALPIPEEGRPQERRRLRRGSGFSILLFGVLLVAGAWYGGKYAWVILHPAAAEAPPPRRNVPHGPPRPWKSRARPAGETKGAREARGVAGAAAPDRARRPARGRGAAPVPADHPRPRRRTAAREAGGRRRAPRSHEGHRGPRHRAPEGHDGARFRRCCRRPLRPPPAPPPPLRPRSLRPPRPRPDVPDAES